jgi:hypothetical protein
MNGKTFAVTDGGTNCHSAAVGTGQVLKRNFNMINVTTQNIGELGTYHEDGHHFHLENPNEEMISQICVALN